MPTGCAQSSSRELERPGRNDLVFFHHGAAHAVAALVALLDALEAAVTAGGVGVEREDRIAREHEASAQCAERRARRRPVRRARAGRERLDLVAVLVQRRAIAAHAQHALEAPFAVVVVVDRGLAGDRSAASGRVAVLAFGEPVALPQEKGVLYPWTFTESAGT